jgi:ABC-type lipoprotein release transport system permease subunit
MGVLVNAGRNLFRNLKRYRVLLLSLILISTVLVFVVAVFMGMRASIYEKAGRYFAGDIVVMGFAGNGRSLIEDPEAVMSAVLGLGEGEIRVRAFSRRSTYYDLQNIDLFFSGYYLKQRRLVGVEWELERPALEGFSFSEGAAPEAGDESAVLISSAAAEKLHIAVGDELLVSIRSDRGRTNTANFIVRGIFEESSFFGYQPYIHRRALNRLREAPVDQVNEIGVYLEDPIRNEDAAAGLILAELEKTLPSFGLMNTRDEYEAEADKKRESREYGVVTVGAQLQEIQDLLEAVTIIAGIVALMFLGIVTVGVGNTFTMVVWERTREIGTLRALGMQRGRLVLSFLAEAVFLGLAGTVSGLLLGIGVLEFFRFSVEFPHNMATTLFMTGGRLEWVLPPRAIAAIVVLTVGSCTFGSLRASVRAGRMEPVEALRHRG